MDKELPCKSYFKDVVVSLLLLDRASNAKFVLDLVDSSYPGTHPETQTMNLSEPSGKKTTG